VRSIEDLQAHEHARIADAIWDAMTAETKYTVTIHLRDLFAGYLVVFIAVALWLYAKGRNDWIASPAFALLLAPALAMVYAAAEFMWLRLVLAGIRQARRLSILARTA
jgi:hypothetical protein